VLESLREKKNLEKRREVDVGIGAPTRCGGFTRTEGLRRIYTESESEGKGAR